MEYLNRTVAEAKRTETPGYGMTVYGYTKRSGAPTGVMVRFPGESRWRRIMVWCFSNAGTAFVRIGGKPFVLSPDDENAIERALSCATN